MLINELKEQIELPRDVRIRFIEIALALVPARFVLGESLFENSILRYLPDARVTIPPNACDYSIGHLVKGVNG